MFKNQETTFRSSKDKFFESKVSWRQLIIKFKGPKGRTVRDMSLTVKGKVTMIPNICSKKLMTTSKRTRAWNNKMLSFWSN